MEDYRYQSRGGSGVISHKITEKTGPVAAVKVVRPEEDILLVTDDGTMIRVRVDRISEVGRNSQGVHVMRLAEGSRVIDIEKTERVTDADNQPADSELISAEEEPGESAEAEEAPENETS